MTFDRRYFESLTREPAEEPMSRSLAASAALHERARRRIPSCTQTFSKGTSQYMKGVAPAFLAKGRGSHVWDVDGNEYIDYSMALGPVVLGYADPEVDAAAIAALRDGITLSLAHPLEIEVAELLAEVVPGAEMTRFGKNGSDATSGAVRLARAFTGRDVIACCGYHGWQDWYIGTTSRSRGVPAAVRQLTETFAYNDLASLERVFERYPGRVAAVIMEPVGVVEPRDSFLERVAALARREGALLVFDEIVTGFRLALGGAAELFGVTPDVSCFGKAMANGFPVSAVVGRRELMELFDEIFFSFTFAGETASLAAAKTTITALRERRVIPTLWARGAALRDGYNTLAAMYGLERFTGCVGYPPRTVFWFKDEAGQESLPLKSLFHQECVEQGLLLSVGQNLCFAHGDDDLDRTFHVYRTCFEILAAALKENTVLERLKGPALQPVMRKP